MNLTSRVERQAKALRREVYVVLKSVDYDYERMPTTNTVASGACKLLNAWKPTRDASDLAVLREGFGILLLYPILPSPAPCWRKTSSFAAKGATFSTPWPKVAEEALVQTKSGDVASRRQAAWFASKVSPNADRRLPSKPPPWRRLRLGLPKAKPPRRSSWCQVAWSTWWSDASALRRLASSAHRRCCSPGWLLAASSCTAPR